MNSTVHRILASCTVVLKDGISLTLLILMLSSKLSSSRWDILYVDVKIAPPPDGTFLMLMSLLTSKLSSHQMGHPRRARHQERGALQPRDGREQT